MQLQLQRGLGDAVQSQATQQASIAHLSSVIVRSHKWLCSLADRCASQGIELPIEYAHRRLPLPSAPAAR